MVEETVRAPLPDAVPRANPGSGLAVPGALNQAEKRRLEQPEMPETPSLRVASTVLG